MVRDILLLGDDRLYERCVNVEDDELEAMHSVVADLDDTLLAYRSGHGAGRAIAAPQIGVMKRIVLLDIDHPVPLIDPVLTFVDDEMMEVLDDCMSFPGLLVRVRRHVRCTVSYRDPEGKSHVWNPEGDLSELLQHECDHLDGILATMRAIDDQSFVMRR